MQGDDGVVTGLIHQGLHELDNEKVKAQEERDRAEGLRAAFNADKQALLDRVSTLEGEVRERENASKDL